MVLHQGNPSGVVVLLGRILQNLLAADIEIVGDKAFDLQAFLASLDRRNER